MDTITKEEADRLNALQEQKPAEPKEIANSEEALKHLSEPAETQTFKVDPAAISEFKGEDDEGADEQPRIAVEGSPLADVAIKQQPFMLDLSREGSVHSPVAEVDIKVEVTPAEQDKFVDALMSDDTFFELPISIIKDRLSFTFRSRSVVETNLISHWADSAELKPWEFVVNVQRAYCAMQLVAVNGKRLPEIEVKTVGDVGRIVQERIHGISHTKYDFMLEAFRIFDQKERILKSQLINKDFTNPKG